MSYAGPSSASATWTSAEYPESGLGPTYPSRQDFFEHSYSYPDLSGFGIGTILEIDDAPPNDPPSGPITSCIWASNDFEFYETVSHNSLRSDFGGGCDAQSFKLANFSGPSPWTYNNSFGLRQWPSGYSPNRSRTNHVTTDSRCGTLACMGPFGLTNPWTCGIRVSGLFALLQISKRSTSYFFTVLVSWMPERFQKEITRRRALASSPQVPSIGFAVHSEGLFDNLSGSSAAIDAFMLAMYPAATSLNNIWQGPILRYEKQIVCSTDFDGTPVTLPLAEELKKLPFSTQTMCQAAGIVNIPSTITITPV